MKANTLPEGSPIPKFRTKDESGCFHSDETISGQTTLLYFYPRDNTPGCTVQACDLRDSYEELKRLSVSVLAVSGCSLASHQKFKNKFSIPFPLLLDEDHVIAKLFGVWGEKKFMGKTFEGIHRTSFLINKSGKIEKTYTKVKAKMHLSMILQDLEQFADP